MKTILLYVQSDQTLVPQLEAAMALARCFSAHLTCLHVTPIEAYVALGAFDGAILNTDVRDALEIGKAAVRASVEDQMRAEDVSWDFEQVVGHVATTIVSHASLVDLLVIGRESQYGAGRWASQTGLLGDLLHRCRTPLFIPNAESTAVNAAGPALVAWDGSCEAANAIRASIAFLKAASQVHLLRIERIEEDQFPDMKVIQYLSRHGIHAQLETQTSRYDDVATLLVDEAARRGATTVIMGAYNHSRVGELLFGGVTRSLLLDCPVSLLLAH